MPELDFMVVCDYVRAQQGVLHMIGAGFDRIHAAQMPSMHNIGVALRLLLTRSECEGQHTVDLTFRNEHQELVSISSIIANVSAGRDIPHGWPIPVTLPVQLGLPLPSYGPYTLSLRINGHQVKSILMLVEPPPSSHGG